MSLLMRAISMALMATGQSTASMVRRTCGFVETSEHFATVALTQLVREDVAVVGYLLLCQHAGAAIGTSLLSGLELAHLLDCLAGNFILFCYGLYRPFLISKCHRSGCLSTDSMVLRLKAALPSTLSVATAAVSSTIAESRLRVC